MQQISDIIQNIVTMHDYAHYIGEVEKVREIAIFRGLADSDIKKIEKCLGIKTEKFNTDETILSYNGNMGNSGNIGVMVSGTAELVSYDYDGNRSLLERYEKNAMFGELFTPSLDPEAVSVVATTLCEVIFFQYKNILAPCENTCSFHHIFLSNVIGLLTEKLRTQSAHIEVLSKRSLREKLWTYFQLQAQEQCSLRFTLPFSLYTLADYLNIDRSAMQREMKKMREDGIITTKGKRIELLRKM